MTAPQGITAVLFIDFKTIFNIDYNNQLFAAINPFQLCARFLILFNTLFSFSGVK